MKNVKVGQVVRTLYLTGRAPVLLPSRTEATVVEVRKRDKRIRLDVGGKEWWLDFDAVEPV